MNKSDWILIITIAFLCILWIVFPFAKQEPSQKIAVVYYKNKEIKTIPLNQNETKEYEVVGENGKIQIEVKNGKVRVKQENSPLHICSKQGFIEKSTETIVCLPNKIVIKIKEKDPLDTIVR